MYLKLSLLLLLCLFGRGTLAATLATIRITLEEAGSKGTDYAVASETDRVIQALASSNATQLASLVQDQQVMIQDQQVMIQNLLELERNGSERVAWAGTNYIRWGRRSCPASATILYQGYAAKSHYSNTGGGVDYQCLSNNPEHPEGITGGGQHASYMYGTEYEHSQTEVLKDINVHDHDVPCVACEVEGRGQNIMIPARRSCPEAWTMEYSGLLMSAHVGQQKSNYLCVDKHPEKDEGGVASQNGALLYLVEVQCGSLPCPPFVTGYEVACEVCTK